VLPFLGWMHPDIPHNARLHYARGVASVPDAGSAGTPFPVSLDGVSPFGGSGYLFRVSGMSGPAWRARVIALGWGVQGWRRPLSASAVMAPASGYNLVTGGLAPDTANGYGAALDAAQLAGTRGVHLSELVLSASATGLILYDGATPIAYLGGPGQPTVLRNVVIDSGWQVSNPTGGPVTLAVQAVESDTRARDSVGVDIVTRPVNAAGAVGATAINVASGRADARVVQLLEDDARPELRPVAPGGRALELDEARAYGIGVGQTLAGIVPTSARVVAELAVAVWREDS